MLYAFPRIALIGSQTIVFILARLSQRIWKTTPRGAVNQELKLLTMHVILNWLGKNSSVSSSRGLGLTSLLSFFRNVIYSKSNQMDSLKNAQDNLLLGGHFKTRSFYIRAILQMLFLYTNPGFVYHL